MTPAEMVADDVLFDAFWEWAVSAETHDGPPRDDFRALLAKLVEHGYTITRIGAES